MRYEVLVACKMPRETASVCCSSIIYAEASMKGHSKTVTLRFASICCVPKLHDVVIAKASLNVVLLPYLPTFSFYVMLIVWHFDEKFSDNVHP